MNTDDDKGKNGQTEKEISVLVATCPRCKRLVQLHCMNCGNKNFSNQKSMTEEKNLVCSCDQEVSEGICECRTKISVRFFKEATKENLDQIFEETENLLEMDETDELKKYEIDRALIHNIYFLRKLGYQNQKLDELIETAEETSIFDDFSIKRAIWAIIFGPVAIMIYYALMRAGMGMMKADAQTVIWYVEIQKWTSSILHWILGGIVFIGITYNTPIGVLLVIFAGFIIGTILIMIYFSLITYLAAPILTAIIFIIIRNKIMDV